jgi:hypothetical protein
MLSARCKNCNVELTSTNKPQSCGCPNMMTLIDDKITAVNLDLVVLTKTDKSIKSHTAFTEKDLEYQENRRKRKVRKLNFEIR